ncbi:Fe-S-cluster-containing hydrogenase component 2 [Novosphingobium taihuense]|uniref:Fe-S-cluster-containing hydrogenase component 2/CRP-like cAMP-binding protein/thioredoxin reductase n=2 Tax=Novosphingobium taihuense TaxID=260085 RepID=A0A7W7ACN5_9SPHN|nr:cyclic nucleotide-binding domain-containing protein [Novosphingobium taihuense]MBB4614421.1 Fe-S-cluster-containing hydrogenase component 2/CRP-like cAMP-binding protein/thioredoxin reductase [Novosphingobium taihuense]TWH86336.1 Fe-S-cluster-containing hydrogenase component 2 [Novosphingobium taihuense]
MGEVFKVAIIGSGPAGMSAAGRAAQLGLSHVLLEKTDHLSDTIYKYQKGKHVMATPSQLILRSDQEFDAGKKEDILDKWNRRTAELGVNVKYNAEVKSIKGTGPAIEGSVQKIVTRARDGSSTTTELQRFAPPYAIELTSGETVMAENVVLAIGTQGNPNLMRCPGGDLPHVTYQLDDPYAVLDQHIVVVGTGDAGIENARGLVEDPAQGNVVTVLNRAPKSTNVRESFATAKEPNAKALVEDDAAGKLTIRYETETKAIEPGWITLSTRDGEERIRCDRIIARIGSAPPRGFVEGCGIEFASADRLAFPTLSPQFESTAPGIFVIGALAGYPLIKHCMNQGYDVVEFINGNTGLKPADEPLLEAKFAGLPGNRSVNDWLEFLRTNVTILDGMTTLQLREFMLDSAARAYAKGETVFEKNDPGSSLFAIASGSVHVRLDPKDPSKVVPIPAGTIFGEVGLISGRKRGATIVAAEDTICVEISRNAALKLQSQVPTAKRAIERISTERQILQMFGSGLTSADIAEVVESSKIMAVRAGDAIINEGDEDKDIYVIRVGSMVVEKEVGGKPVFLSYLPAGSYVGEMALIDGGRRTATVRAAIKSEVIKIDGEAFGRVLAAKPALLERARKDMEVRRATNAFIESKKDSFSGVVDLYSEQAKFLVSQGLGEATDVLLIDERLCVGCDNCEKACADSHDGLSRLDREAGKSFAHLHVPTSCRHCEHPHCMADCPPNAIHRGPDGEVFINDTCIGCGNCQRNCPYGVIRMDKVPPKKPSLLSWLFFGSGPGPGEPSYKWSKKNTKYTGDPAVDELLDRKKAIKCDMCAGIEGGPSCVRACPTGAAIRVSPDEFLTVARLENEGV